MGSHEPNFDEFYQSKEEDNQPEKINQSKEDLSEEVNQLNKVHRSEEVNLPEEVDQSKEVNDPEEVNLSKEVIRPKKENLPEEVSRSEEVNRPEQDNLPVKVNLPEEVAQLEEDILSAEVIQHEELKLPEEVEQSEEVTLSEEVNHFKEANLHKESEENSGDEQRTQVLSSSVGPKSEGTESETQTSDEAEIYDADSEGSETEEPYTDFWGLKQGELTSSDEEELFEGSSETSLTQDQQNSPASNDSEPGSPQLESEQIGDFFNNQNEEDECSEVSSRDEVELAENNEDSVEPRDQYLNNNVSRTAQIDRNRRTGSETICRSAIRKYPRLCAPKPAWFIFNQLHAVASYVAVPKEPTPLKEERKREKPKSEECTPPIQNKRQRRNSSSSESDSESGHKSDDSSGSSSSGSGCYCSHPSSSSSGSEESDSEAAAPNQNKKALEDRERERKQNDSSVAESANSSGFHSSDYHRSNPFDSEGDSPKAPESPKDEKEESESGSEAGSEAGSVSESDDNQSDTILDSSESFAKLEQTPLLDLLDFGDSYEKGIEAVIVENPKLALAIITRLLGPEAAERWSHASPISLNRQVEVLFSKYRSTKKELNGVFRKVKELERCRLNAQQTEQQKQQEQEQQNQQNQQELLQKIQQEKLSQKKREQRRLRRKAKEKKRQLEIDRVLRSIRLHYLHKLQVQREQFLLDLKKEQELRQEQQEQREQTESESENRKPMQNEMVSIPVANLNGGLKAASSGSGVGGVATGGVVSSAVLANAPRVYLTPSSTFMANRQASAGVAGVVATGKIGGSVVGSSSGTSTAAGTVRYFSQFSKVQTAGGPSVQRKLANGDTIVLANCNKGLFFTSNSSSTTPITTTTTTASSEKGSLAATTNGNSLIGLTTKTELLAEEQEELVEDMQRDQSTVISLDEDDEDDENVNEDGDSSQAAGKPSGEQSQEKPLALLTAANNAVNESGSNNEDEPELDIVINNVVCSFSVGCHLKLRDIALKGSNVEYRRENGMVTMKLRHPYTTASIWSSGRITCTGATSEAMAKVAARRYARCLGKLGFPTRFLNFRIVNVLGTCSMPWAIKIVNFSERHRDNASYEPELHPGVTYKMREPEPKATLKIFSTGSVTVTAASVSNVESAIQHIFPLVFEFRKQRSPEELQHLRQKQRLQADPNELEKLVVSESKAAAQDNIFVNTTAAHTKPAPGDNTTPATSGIMTSKIDSMQRLKQMENYHQMMQLTQEERRHIPFQGDKVVNTSASTSKAAAAGSSSSTADNICANARRRATECWATKLQNKRPRYNDPGTTGTLNNNAASSSSSSSASVLASASTSAASSSNVGSSQSQSQATQLRNPLKTAALANARMRGVVAKAPTTTGGMVIKPGSRIAPTAGSGYLHDLQLQQQQMLQKRLQLMQQQQQQKKMRQTTSFSPSDFQVDDLIEEEESNEMDLQY